MELAQAGVLEDLPQAPGLGVAVFKGLGPATGFFLDLGIFLGRLADADVEVVQKRDLVRGGPKLIEGQALALPPGDEAAKGRAPVPQEVDACHLPARRLVAVGQGVADHGRADVVEGEVLGDVGRGEIDAHLLASSRRRAHRRPPIGQARQQGRGHRGRGQGQVQERTRRYRRHARQGRHHRHQGRRQGRWGHALGLGQLEARQGQVGREALGRGGVEDRDLGRRYADKCGNSVGNGGGD